MLDVQKIGPRDSKYPTIKGKEARGHTFGVERALLIMRRPCLSKTSYGMTSTEFGLTTDLLDVHCNSRQSEELIVNRAMCY